MIRLFTVILVFFSIALFGQSVKDSSLFIPIFKGSFSFQFPGGDLKERFGNNLNIGGGFQIKTKSNFVYIIEGNFLFGNNISDEVTTMFDGIKTSSGDIIDQNGEFATVLLSQRGFYVGGRIGYIIPVFGSNPNSGIFISLGSGLLQHKIRIENDGNRTPQILNDYKKGYDKLTNGIAISEFIGYSYLGNKKIVNFFVGFDFYQAWTKSRRDYDFILMEKDTEERFDILSGFRVGWMIPIYKRMSDGHYYY